MKSTKISIWALAAWGLWGGSARADDVRDYGEYLAGECTSCHQLDGSDKGIPSIVGWDPESFVSALEMFKTGERTNPAMVSVAKSLDDEQIRALAVYFHSLNKTQ